MRTNTSHLWQTIRGLAVLVIGIPPTVLITGVFYSMSDLPRGGHYGTAMILASVLGVCVFVLAKLGACYRNHPAILLSAVLIFAVAPVIIGHAIEYGETQTFAWRMVQDDTVGQYPSTWKVLGPEEVFSHVVGWHTGTPGDGVWDYLRFQAALGWEGRETVRYYSRTQRTKLWVWLAWLWHMVFFLLASAIGFGAAIPDEFLAEEDDPQAARHFSEKPTLS